MLNMANDKDESDGHEGIELTETEGGYEEESETEEENNSAPQATHLYIPFSCES